MEKGMPLIDDKFPELKVKTTHGDIELPDHFEGKWFILFSHPGDFTLPADWPKNEIVGDRVIMPPASDVKTAEERMKKYECSDWWLCHKN